MATLARPPRLLLHKICACPHVIGWIMATVPLWALLTARLANGGAFQSEALGWKPGALLCLCYACTAGLGFFAGVFFISWWVIPRCRRANGAPFYAGERVLMLSGPQKGVEAVVTEIRTGQGGQPLLDLRSGEGDSEANRILLDDYEVLRLSPVGPREGAQCDES